MSSGLERLLVPARQRALALSSKSAAVAPAEEEEGEGPAVETAAATAIDESEEDETTAVTAPPPPPPPLLLPPGAAPRLAQLILAAQATHGLDAFPAAEADDTRSILAPSHLHAHGRAVLAAGADAIVAVMNEAPQPPPAPCECAVAAAHYLSLAGWAAAHFGEEHRSNSSASADVQRLEVSSMVVNAPEEVLLVEGPEGRLRRRRGGVSGAGMAAAAAAMDDGGDGGGFWPSFPALQHQDGNGGGLVGGEMEFMRARAEGGDASALVWMAQSLYWGRHGLQPDRAAAAR